MLLGPRFPNLDLDKAVQMAIIHDKMEIFIGDELAFDRVGKSQNHHGFNVEVKAARDKKERLALRRYLAHLPSAVSILQRPLFYEYLAKVTPESRFINAIDKMLPLIYVIYSKSGRHARDLPEDWIEFGDIYRRPHIERFPELLPYYEELVKLAKVR